MLLFLCCSSASCTRIVSRIGSLSNFEHFDGLEELDGLEEKQLRP
jgi:hypothetical protein